MSCDESRDKVLYVLTCIDATQLGETPTVDLLITPSTIFTAVSSACFFLHFLLLVLALAQHCTTMVFLAQVTRLICFMITIAAVIHWLRRHCAPLPHMAMWVQFLAALVMEAKRKNARIHSTFTTPQS